MGLVNSVMVQMTDMTNNATQIFTSPWLTGANTAYGNQAVGLYSYNLDVPIDKSQVDQVSVSYGDILGNSYSIIFWK
jgi:hypothetical protein